MHKLQSLAKYLKFYIIKDAITMTLTLLLSLSSLSLYLGLSSLIDFSASSNFNLHPYQNPIEFQTLSSLHFKKKKKTIGELSNGNNCFHQSKKD